MYTEERIQVVEAGRELVLRGATPGDGGEWGCTVQVDISTQYLHTIYTISTQYLHNIYTLSTQVLCDDR